MLLTLLIRSACRWLLIFDNVENADLLMAHWPTAPRGQVEGSQCETYRSRAAGNSIELGYQTPTSPPIGL